MLQIDPVWRRRLVLLSGENAGVRTIALGALAAGAAVLWTTADPSVLREANQAGATDFSVDSLYEALRILKNEIRKGNPVSVGLIADPALTWDQAVERGLQPRAIWTGDDRLQAAAVTFEQRGARRLPPSMPTGNTAIDLAASWRDRRTADADLLAKLSTPSETPQPPSAAIDLQLSTATQWLTAAQSLFPRDLFRCYSPAWFVITPAASNRGV